MAKKFNGHRCERRNLTDLVLGTGPTGKKRAKPKAKKRPKNYTTEPAANRMELGGDPLKAASDYLRNSVGGRLLGLNNSGPQYSESAYKPFDPNNPLPTPQPGTINRAFGPVDYALGVMPYRVIKPVVGPIVDPIVGAVGRAVRPVGDAISSGVRGLADDVVDVAGYLNRTLETSRIPAVRRAMQSMPGYGRSTNRSLDLYGFRPVADDVIGGPVLQKELNWINSPEYARRVRQANPNMTDRQFAEHLRQLNLRGRQTHMGYYDTALGRELDVATADGFMSPGSNAIGISDDVFEHLARPRSTVSHEVKHAVSEANIPTGSYKNYPQLKNVHGDRIHDAYFGDPAEQQVFFRQMMDAAEKIIPGFKRGQQLTEQQVKKLVEGIGKGGKGATDMKLMLKEAGITVSDDVAKTAGSETFKRMRLPGEFQVKLDPYDDAFIKGLTENLNTAWAALPAVGGAAAAAARAKTTPQYKRGGLTKMSLGNPTNPNVYVDDPLENAQLALAARAGQLMNRFSNPYGGTYDERHPAVMSFIDDELLGGRFGNKQDDFQYQYLPAGMEDVTGNYRRLGKNMPMSGVPEGATNVTQQFIGAPWSAGTVSHLASAYDPTFQGSTLHADYINRGFVGEGNYEAEKLKRNTGYQPGDILFGGRLNQESYGQKFGWYRRQAKQGNRYGSHSDIIYDVTTDEDGNALYHVMGGNMSDTLFDRTYTADQLRNKYTGRLHNNAPYQQAGQQVEEDAYSFSMPNVDASRSDQLSVEDLNMMGRDMQLSPFKNERKSNFFGRVGSVLGSLLMPGLGVGAAFSGTRKMYLGEPTNPTSAVTPEMQEALLRQEAEAKLAALQADRQLFNNRTVSREEPMYNQGLSELERAEAKADRLAYHNKQVHDSMLKDMQGKTKMSPGTRQLLGMGLNQLGNAVEDDNAVAGGLLKGAGTLMPFASTLGLPGVLAGAGVGALGAAFRQRQEEERPLQDMADARRARAEVEPERMQQFNEQAYADYAQYGNINPLLYARYGGPMEAPDYETEGGEMIMASPNDPPKAMGSGNYKQETSNMYRIQGPKHEQGGVPTKGAMAPYVDAYGQQHDSPYVFSDAAEMKFDPSDILKMLG